jgi:hypothetical protein
MMHVSSSKNERICLQLCREGQLFRPLCLDALGRHSLNPAEPVHPNGGNLPKPTLADFTSVGKCLPYFAREKIYEFYETILIVIPLFKMRQTCREILRLPNLANPAGFGGWKPVRRQGHQGRPHPKDAQSPLHPEGRARAICRPVCL